MSLYTVSMCIPALCLYRLILCVFYCICIFMYILVLPCVVLNDDDDDDDDDYRCTTARLPGVRREWHYSPGVSSFRWSFFSCAT